MSAGKNRAQEQKMLRLASTFGVAAESAQSFGRWHKGLKIAKEVCTVGVGMATLVGIGAPVPAFAAAFGISVTGHVLINKFLPMAFPKLQSAPSKLDA